MDTDKEITAKFAEVEENGNIPGFTTMLLLFSTSTAVAIYYGKKR